MSGAGSGSGSTSRRFPSRLEAINRHLAPAIRTASGMDRAGASILRALAEQSDVRGRVWSSPARLVEDTHFADGTVRATIKRLAENGLLFYVEAAAQPRIPLPWTFRRDGVKIPTTAWGFWVPLAACTRSVGASEAVCLASMRAHRDAAAKECERVKRKGLWTILHPDRFDELTARVADWEEKNQDESRRAHEDAAAMARDAAEAASRNAADLDAVASEESAAARPQAPEGTRRAQVGR